MAEKLEFDILVGKNDLSKALDHTAKTAGSISNALASGFGAAPIEEATSAVDNLNKQTSSYITTTVGVAAGQLAYNLVSQAIGFVTSSIRESVVAFQEQEDAINKLRQAYALTGGATDSAVEGVVAFASSLEASSKFSDDAIIGQVAFIKSLGATTQVSKDLVLAAANLSATIGGSLEENVDKLGKTLSGTAGRLGQYIPELKSLTTEQLRAGDAARIINEKFDGSAANDLKTYSGQMASLSNAFNNLQEVVGESIAKSSVWQTILEKTKKVIDETNNSISAGNVYDSYSKGQGIASKTSEQLANDTVVLDNEIKNLQKSLEEQAARSSFSKFIFDDDASAVIALRVKELVKLRTDMEERLQTSRLSTQGPVEKPVDIVKTNEEVDAATKRNAQIIALDQQLALARSDIKAQEINSQIESDNNKNIAEIERIFAQETQKAEIQAQLKSSELSTNLTADEANQERIRIAKEKELSILDASAKKELALQANTIKTRQAAEAARDAYEQKQKKERLDQENSFFNAAISLQSAKNKELAAIGKAAAIVRATINGTEAVSNSYLFGTRIGGPITGAAFAGIAAAATAAQIAAIAGVQFEQGGPVGGINGASAGPDNRVATIRDGEFVLTGADQKILVDALKSGNLGGGQIIVQIDGRAIATAVRDQVQSGFRIA